MPTFQANPSRFAHHRSQGKPGLSLAACIRHSALREGEPPMIVHEASFNGTLRTISLLLVAWFMLRWFVKLQNARAARNAGHAVPRDIPQRPKGEVRIERPNDPSRTGKPLGRTIVDADFEEIK